MPQPEYTPQPPGSGPPPSDILIEFREVCKAFGEKIVLNEASLAIRKGTTGVIMGGSGTGKSVAIKHVVRLLEPDSGEIWVLGQRVSDLNSREMDQLRLRIGYLFQSGALFDSMTVSENLAFILERHTKLTEAQRNDRIREALSWVNLPNVLGAYPAELSGGQKKRVGLARAILLEPEILLYDEPTTGLDPVSVRLVSDLINRLKAERGITSVAITHDLLCAELVADAVFFLLDHHFPVQGTLYDVARSDRPEIREFFADSLDHLSSST